MQDDMLRYTKFVGPLTPAAGHAAAEHFAACGLKTKVLSSPEATELGKLSETTYFGVLISFAQELERYCDRVGADYDEVISLFEGINFLPPVKYFPGVIGGHCVMPNIAILSKVDASPLLQAIKATNLEKIRREAKKQSSEETNKAGIAARSEMV
jgi:UDP-N-acetyl-D-mannosaminuronate dehydrogenase